MTIKRKGGLGEWGHRVGQEKRRRGRASGSSEGKGKGIRDSNALWHLSGKQYLISKLVAPGLVVICSKALSGRQGLSQLPCNGACIPSQAQSCLLNVPLARGDVCQDELDTAAPFRRLSKVQLPVQPMWQQPIGTWYLMIWGVKPDMAHHMSCLKCIPASYALIIWCIAEQK